MSTGQRFTGALAYLIIQSKRRDKLDSILKLTFLSFQLTDLVLTLVAARYGWPELNPLMQGSVGSLTMMAVFKFIVPVLISWFVPGRWLLPAIILLGCVLGWNVKEIIGLYL
jgi:hypothetical protein